MQDNHSQIQNAPISFQWQMLIMLQKVAVTLSNLISQWTDSLNTNGTAFSHRAHDF